MHDGWKKERGLDFIYIYIYIYFNLFISPYLCGSFGTNQNSGSGSRSSRRILGRTCNHGIPRNGCPRNCNLVIFNLKKLDDTFQAEQIGATVGCFQDVFFQRFVHQLGNIATGWKKVNSVKPSPGADHEAIGGQIFVRAAMAARYGKWLEEQPQK